MEDFVSRLIEAGLTEKESTMTGESRISGNLLKRKDTFVKGRTLPVGKKTFHA
jgi:hypothetical protein